MYMNKETSASDSIEEKKWYKNAMAIIAIIVAIVGMVSGIINFYSGLFKEGVSQNIEFVLDRSANLQEDFNETMKIKAIKDAMVKALGVNVGENENVALR